ncbi:hypothetical protein ACFVVU_08595 [Kitasatospora sp. NPDC057965]|uniref:hypothetical protein n=1 Tax=Kitasatospora sp. NPDC057965 TaxID=3346291 RepID=UPI0036DE5217
MPDPPTPREVNVEVVPAEGYELEIEGVPDCPFVTVDDLDRHFEEVVAEHVRTSLSIPDDVPVVLHTTDSDGETTRTEHRPVPRP